MQFNLLDRIGDWNPQLFRELKGRLKFRNIAIAAASSLLGQFVLFMYWLNQLPREPYGRGNLYCRLHDTYNSHLQQDSQLHEQYRQLQAQFSRYSSPKNFDPEKVQQLKGSIAEVKERIQDLQPLLKDNLCPQNAIEISLWWQDHYPKIFTSLSLFVAFILLVVGTYMLISNLAGEERQGTLNFIRLSPRSALSVLGGKLLGVPILLYLAAVLTVPLHLWLGLSAQVPLGEIFCFYAVVIASCAFFYSAALLFGLVTSWLGGFQAWLGSGAVLMFFWIVNFRPIDHTPFDWLNLFSPSVVLPYLVDRTGTAYTSSEFPFAQGAIQNWQWFYLPVGATGISLVLFVLLHYGLWTGWIWQTLNRRFHNPNATILSKRQSYWLVGCFEVVTLGFAMGQTQAYYFGSTYQNFTNLLILALFNLALFLGLIALLSPNRQVVQDWARYRRESRSTRKGFWNRAWVQDLIGGEKSPALMTIALNLAIAITPFLVWISLWPGDSIDKTKAFLAVAFFVTLMMIYATLAQLMLLMKTQKRSLWAAGTITALVVLPPIILGFFGLDAYKNPTLWLFSTFPWLAMENAATTTIFMALLGEWSVLVLLNLRLTRQLRQAGESASKALLAGRPSLPS